MLCKRHVSNITEPEDVPDLPNELAFYGWCAFLASSIRVHQPRAHWASAHSLLEVHMAGVFSPSGFSTKWGPEARALAEQAKVLSGTKLAQLVRRLQRQTGSTQEECWRFVIKHGIKGEVDYRRWQEE